MTWMLLLLIAAQANAREIIFDQHTLDHIHFKRIKPNTVSFHDGIINIDVDNSASLMLLAFDSVEHVQSVTFHWKSAGVLNKKSAQEETTRKGDDAWLRVGLILKGEPQLPDPLAPPWARQVRKTLKFPSGKIVCLVPEAMHLPGEVWISPYGSNVDMISVKSHDLENGWKLVSHRFSTSLETIGIWIMSDGDNTHSKFNTQLKQLVIE